MQYWVDATGSDKICADYKTIACLITQSYHGEYPSNQAEQGSFHFKKQLKSICSDSQLTHFEGKKSTRCALNEQYTLFLCCCETRKVHGKTEQQRETFISLSSFSEVKRAERTRSVSKQVKRRALLAFAQTRRPGTQTQNTAYITTFIYVVIDF